MLVTERSRNSPVELEELLARCVGKAEFARRVLDRFVGCFGADIDRLERHLLALQADDAARVAHTMKGAAASVAAHGLAEQIAEIEALARKRELDDLTAHLTRLRVEWSRVSESVAEIGGRDMPPEMAAGETF